MRLHIPILVLNLFSGLVAFGQIQITQDDVPQIGHTYSTKSIDTIFVDAQLSKKGTDQTWDYSGFKGGDLGTATFNSPTADDLKNFPNATLVELTNGASASYYNVGSTNISYLGFRDSIVNKFNPALLYANLPVVFGNNDQSTSQIVYKAKNPGTYSELPTTVADSIRITLTFDKHDTVDGWGTIKTPLASYDALRVVTYVKVTSKIEIRIVSPFPLGWTDGTSQVPAKSRPDSYTKEYNWWAKGVGAPVFTLDVNHAASDTATSVSWSVDNLSAVSNAIPQNAVVIAPNPVSTFAQVIITENGTYSYSLANMTGTTMQSGKMNQGSNALQFNGMNEGLYLLKITDDAGRTLVKKIEVQK